MANTDSFEFMESDGYTISGNSIMKDGETVATFTNESGKLVITVYSDEPEEKFRKLAKNVEFRCPVMNLLAAAKVDMEVTWMQKPAADYAGNVD